MGNFALGVFIIVHEAWGDGDRPALLAVGLTLLVGSPGLLALERKWGGRNS